MQIVCMSKSLSDEGNVAKKKGLELNLNPLFIVFLVVGNIGFEPMAFYMSTEYLVDEVLFNKNFTMLILWISFRVDVYWNNKMGINLLCLT